MVRSVFIAALLLLQLSGLVTLAHADGSKLVTIATPRGQKQVFIHINPGKSKASVILFAGGHGALGLRTPTSMKWGAGNFLVRTRDKFAAQGFTVAVVDAPSDRSKGMNASFRMGKGHADDISAVASYLKQQSPVPVWLVGTSMGTFSAANGAIRTSNIDGLVLTSTITRARSKWKIASSHKDGVASMPLSKISVPTLIVSHKQDGCKITPAADANKLQAGLSNASKKEILLLDGGKPARSAPCKAKSAHGFLGIEGKAVAAIADFIRANSR